MGLGHNRTGTQQEYYTTGSGTQCDRDNVIGTQLALFTMGLGHTGADPADARFPALENFLGSTGLCRRREYWKREYNNVDDTSMCKLLPYFAFFVFLFCGLF